MISSAIDSVLREAVERNDVAGVVAVAVNASGTTYEGAFGRQRVAEGVDMRFDSVFRIASMTKGLTSTAAMQLIEGGKLDLDAPAAEIVPEIAEIQVLDGDDLRPPARPITLRHLLTHTSGFANGFTSSALKRYMAAQEDPGDAMTMETPLLFDPGERWQYGVSVDWVGRLVERASSQTLPEYMSEHVFSPLGMVDTEFGLRDDQEPRLTSTHRRLEDGTLTENPVTLPQPNRRGGSGLSSTAPDYARFLRMILGRGDFEGTRLLSAPSIEAMSINQIGPLTAGAWQSVGPYLSNDIDFSDGGTAGHSLGFVVGQRDGEHGRRAGTLSWAGIFNTYYWIDRASDVAGAIFVQVLPFGDAICLRLRDEFERAVYTSVA